MRCGVIILGLITFIGGIFFLISSVLLFKAAALYPNIHNYVVYPIGNIIVTLPIVYCVYVYAKWFGNDNKYTRSQLPKAHMVYIVLAILYMIWSLISVLAILDLFPSNG